EGDAHPQDGNRREGIGHCSEQGDLLVGRAAAGIREGGDMTVRRASEGGGREYHDEVDAEVLPIDRAQIGDRRGEVAAEDVDGDSVAELEAEPIRDAFLERDQRRALVVWLPPLSFNQARARR